MKKLLLLLTVLCPLLALAQAPIPNGDLEYWATAPSGDEIPDSASWQDPDSLGLTNGYPRTIYKTTDAYHGQYAAKIVSSDSNGLRSYGDLVMGACCFQSQYYGVQPYTDRPDSLVFYYKYIVENPDTAIITMQLTMDTPDTTVGGIQEFLMPDTVYTRKSIPVYYSWTTLHPKNLMLRFSSTYSNIPGTGTSSLYIDSVQFVNKAQPTGIASADDNNMAFMYPSPASNQLFIKTHQTDMAHVQLFDITGRLLVNTQVQDNASIDINHLAPGIMLYTITNSTGNIIGRGKICKQ